MSNFPPATCHPYLVQWQNCLGVMIAEDIVLTAGQCGHWDDDPLQDKIVSFPSVPNLYRSIVARFVHPKYNYYTRDYDVQLLKLNKSPMKNERGHDTGIKTISLAREPLLSKVVTEVSMNTNKLTSPFTPEARANKDEPDTLFLQEVLLEPVTGVQCSVDDLLVDEIMLCTVTMDDEDSPQTARTCKASPGSPILDGDSVVAIGSWGKDCSKPNEGGVSTKVSAVADWADNIVSEFSAYSPDHKPYAANGPGKFVVSVQHGKTYGSP